MLKLVVIMSWAAAISAFSLPSLFRREGAVKPCVAVAEAIKDLFDWEEENRVYVSHDENRPIPTFEENLEFFSGIDSDDTALFQELVCLFIEGTDDFIKALKQRGIEAKVVRRMQNYMTASLEMASKYIQPGTPQHDLMTLIVQSGFTDLDPEGVEEMCNVMDLYGTPCRTVDVPERWTPVTCEDIQDAVQPMIPYLFHSLPPQIFDDFLLELACSVFLSQSIEELEQVVDVAGLPTIIVSLLKTQIRAAGKDIPHIESSLEGSDSWGPDDWRENQRRYLNVLYALRDAGMIS